MRFGFQCYRETIWKKNTKKYIDDTKKNKVSTFKVSFSSVETEKLNKSIKRIQRYLLL